MNKQIELTQGKFAIVDDCDHERLIQQKWYYTGKYAARGINIDSKIKTVFMHREILDARPDQHIDHISGDRLDNRRCNLRFATQSQNMANRQRNKVKKNSQYKGVRLTGYKNIPWKANITHNYQTYYLGSFTTEVEAARAYDTKARELFGEFARTNFA